MHVTTTDISLELLLGPQLRAFRDAGYDVIAMSAPGRFVPALEADGKVALRDPGAEHSPALRNPSLDRQPLQRT